MEVALRQRLDGVAGISISESDQTTEVRFDAREAAFSPDTFRQALRQADVDVVTMDVDACGYVEGGGAQPRLRAGRNEFELLGSTDAAPGSAVCVSGRLDDADGGMRLTVTRIDAAPDGFPAPRLDD